MKRTRFFLLMLVGSMHLCAMQSWGQKLQVGKKPASAMTVAEKREALDRIFRDYWESVLKSSPEYASTLGDKRFNDRITDYSLKAYNDQLAREQDYLMQLLAIDTSGLDPQQATSRELLMRQLAEDQDAAAFKEWQMPVNQMDGIHTTYPQLVAQLSFTTVKDYDDWIARLRAVPKAFEQITNNMAAGLDEHRTPPRYLMEKVLAQVKTLADQDEEDSPLSMPLKSFPASISKADRERIADEMLEVVDTQVLPAYLRFARFLEVRYLPGCRTEPGIASIPGGAAYYKFLVRRETTTELTAEQLHQIGLNEVARDEAEMLQIAKQLGFADLASFRASLKSNPKLKPTSAQALLDAYRTKLAPMQAQLSQLFGRLPKQPFEVVAVPDYIAKEAPPAYYQPGAPDGSRPGRLMINASDLEGRSLASVEAVAYHEGIPGHHLQIALTQEQQDLPAFRRNGLSFTAYVEGWALYSERLGKELGFYQDPYSDYGRLDADIWRAIRLVVDTGVHAKGWTRQQMADYFHAHSALDEPTIQAEVDRYIAWPGQGLAYKTGQLTLLTLRAQAQKTLGANFNLRSFHDEVLSAGALPLDALQDRIAEWIERQKPAQ